VWALLALAWFATLAWRPLLEPDEARYAEVPREMVHSGDWVTPRLNDLKYFEKPPLQYWATAAAYSAFGVNEWTARLWSCALAFLCIPLAYAFALYLYGDGTKAIAAASVLAINPYFAIIGQLNILDSGFSFFMVAALFSFIRSRTCEARPGAERGWMVAASASLALAVLSKGIVALVLLGGTLVVHTLVMRDLRYWRRWHLPVTIPVFLAIAVPWFIGVTRRNPEFPQFFFIHEHFQRFLTNEADREGPWWFFLPLLLIALLPWLVPLWKGREPLWNGRGGLRWQRPTDDASTARAMLWSWCAFVLFFFSISHSKLETYILPMMPVLAVLLAPYAVKRASSISIAAWTICGLIVLVAAGLIVGANRKAGQIPSALLVWSIVAAVVGIVAAIAVRRTTGSHRTSDVHGITSTHGTAGAYGTTSAHGTDDAHKAISGHRTEGGAHRHWVIATLGCVLGFQALMLSYSYFPPVRNSKALVAAVKPSIGPDTQLFSVNQYRQGVPP
jgi:4-amino-4-deoxy-L-arabinose transferase-like glycosyltransferase